MAKQFSKKNKFVLTLAIALFSATNAVGGGNRGWLPKFSRRRTLVIT